MNHETMEQHIMINASAARVWQTLTDPEQVKGWANVLSEGSTFAGDWREGGTVTFKDGNDDGIVGTVTAYEPNQLLSIEYTHAIERGTEDPTSDESKTWRGTADSFRLTEASEGGTTLTVTSVVPAEYLDSFLVTWEQALQKIKQLAEQS